MKRTIILLALLVAALAGTAAAEVNHFDLVAEVVSGTLSQPNGPAAVVGLKVRAENGEELSLFCPDRISGRRVFQECVELVLHGIGANVFFRGELREDPANGSTAVIVTRLDILSIPPTELAAPTPRK